MFNINNEDYINDAYNNPDNYEPSFIGIDSVVTLDSIDSDDSEDEFRDHWALDE